MSKFVCVCLCVCVYVCVSVSLSSFFEIRFWFLFFTQAGGGSLVRCGTRRWIEYTNTVLTTERIIKHSYKNRIES